MHARKQPRTDLPDVLGVFEFFTLRVAAIGTFPDFEYLDVDPVISPFRLSFLTKGCRLREDRKRHEAGQARSGLT